MEASYVTGTCVKVVLPNEEDGEERGRYNQIGIIAGPNGYNSATGQQNYNVVFPVKNADGTYADDVNEVYEESDLHELDARACEQYTTNLEADRQKAAQVKKGGRRRKSRKSRKSKKARKTRRR
jgi:hypothetical protein